MADDADRVAEVQGEIAKKIHAHRYDIPTGYPGECDDCGEISKRLIGGRCAVCRDGRMK